jgi:signal transduction histidine kinase
LSGDELRLLPEEQAALRRVATLVAAGARQKQVFAAVAEELGRLFVSDVPNMCRYESDGTFTIVASADNRVRVGSRWPLGGKNVTTIVFETGRPTRLDSYADASGALADEIRGAGVRSAVGTPIIVDGRVWGVIGVTSSLERRLPSDSEARLASFTELVAMAIGNADSRAALARLAEEQAALRRVATLVARAAPPDEVFAAVTREIAGLLPVETVTMARYEGDSAITPVASFGVQAVRLGLTLPLGGNNLATLVARSRRAERMDSYAEATGAIGLRIRDLGTRSSVAAPILVEGRLWGLMSVGTREEPLPRDAEARLTSFTELVATAIANAASRSELAASRARIVAAADEARRRIQRDLHDGSQQQVVSLMLELRAAAAAEPPDVGELRAQLARTAQGLAAVLEELREISQGIYPAPLSRGGLGPALKVLARRSPVPVELDLRAERRLPEHVEVAAYYAVAEALANAAKHAQASLVNVVLQPDDATLKLAIHDDGVGGADPGQGSGLLGLNDRIEALGGTLRVTSPAGSGTTLLIELPIEGESPTMSPKP